jgi:hypothetical protein
MLKHLVLEGNSTAHCFNFPEITLRRFNMKRFLIAAALATFTAPLSVAVADVGVSVSIGQPGFYGQIDIGGFPHPQLIFAQPMIIERGPMNRPPIYLRVPPGHAKNWGKHCREYNACGEQVFFVRDSWYNREYVPRYQERHGKRQDGGRKDDRGSKGKDQRGKGKGDDKGHGRDN